MFVMPGKYSALIALNHASHSHNVIKTLCFFFYCVLLKECRIDGVIKKGGLDCPLLYQIHGVLALFVYFVFLFILLSPIRNVSIQSIFLDLV